MLIQRHAVSGTKKVYSIIKLTATKMHLSDVDFSKDKEKLEFSRAIKMLKP